MKEQTTGEGRSPPLLSSDGANLEVQLQRHLDDPVTPLQHDLPEVGAAGGADVDGRDEGPRLAERRDLEAIDVQDLVPDVGAAPARVAGEDRLDRAAVADRVGHPERLVVGRAPPGVFDPVALEIAAESERERGPARPGGDARDLPAVED